MSKPRIAIPLPTSADFQYNRRNWPQYARAIDLAGGEAVEIPLSATPSEIARLASSCQAVLLPGSPADVNPHKYGHPVDPAAAPTDLPRENADELLLQDAHNLHKPLLGICYGTQSLNVWRGGTLVQDLLDSGKANHQAGASVGVAHSVYIAVDSVLASVVSPEEAPKEDGHFRLSVNSSHHQAIDTAGNNLRIVARSSQDGVIEAVESASPDHFALGVQWHPERSYDISAASRNLFERFVTAAAAWKPREIRTSIG